MISPLNLNIYHPFFSFNWRFLNFHPEAESLIKSWRVIYVLFNSNIHISAALEQLKIWAWEIELADVLWERNSLKAFFVWSPNLLTPIKIV